MPPGGGSGGLLLFLLLRLPQQLRTKNKGGGMQQGGWNPPGELGRRSRAAASALTLHACARLGMQEACGPELSYPGIIVIYTPAWTYEYCIVQYMWNNLLWR